MAVGGGRRGGVFPAAEARQQRLSSSFQAWSGARQRQGWQPLGWLQQEAIYLALISSKQEAIYVAVALYFPKVALYFPKLAATYTGATFVMPNNSYFPKQEANSAEQVPNSTKLALPKSRQR